MIRAIAKRTVSYPLVAALGVAVAIAISATAGEAPAPVGDPARQVIPYDGLLELDGVAVNGLYTLRFELYESPDGAIEDRLWWDDIEVELVGGRFSALLGAAEELTLGLLLAEELYLSIAIENPDNPGAEDFFTLANRQRIVPTPYSYVATEAPDFWVSESLTVEGETRLEGVTTVTNDMEVTGRFDAGGAYVEELTSLGDITAQGGRIQVKRFIFEDVGEGDESALALLDGAGAPASLTVGRLSVADELVFPVGTFAFQTFSTTSNGRYPLTDRDSSFCALSLVAPQDLDANGIASTCEVSRGNTTWVLEASGVATLPWPFPTLVACEATCMVW